jgi:hypothetical protein
MNELRFDQLDDVHGAAIAAGLAPVLTSTAYMGLSWLGVAAVGGALIGYQIDKHLIAPLWK